MNTNILIVIDGEASAPFCMYNAKCTGDIAKDVKNALDWMYDVETFYPTESEIEEIIFRLKTEKNYWLYERFGFEIINVKI